MAERKFKPKASSNIIEGVTPVESTESPSTEIVTESTPSSPVEETPVTVVPEVPEKTPVVTFDDKASTVPVQKNVKVCTRVNHSCTIGGVTYHFVKGKQTNVPANVKAILLKADLLMPL